MNYIKFLQLFIILGSLLTTIGCGNNPIPTDTIDSYNTKTSYLSSQPKIIINEVLAANANTNYDPDFKEFSDWIELYNDTNMTVDLGGYYLSDDKDDLTKWKIPNNTKIKAFQYLLLWADGENTSQKALHTNFKLSQKGETIILSNKEGSPINILDYPALDGDISYGQKNNQNFYMEPTPNHENNLLYQSLLRSSQPIFSLKSGFYDGTKTIELKADGNIYYTVDGSHPTKASKHYHNPIIIDKTTVIRAISIEDDKFPSYSNSHTYLIDEDISLPVISLSIDNKYLYDDKIGIYENHTQDWMRTGNIEFLKNGKSEFSTNVGIRLYGASSREYPQKSFAIFSKRKYGNSSINYPLFSNKPYIKSIKSFILRNSGSDWKSTLIRDALSHSIAKDIGNIDYLSYEPTVTFINGKYYGILNIREKANEDYLVSNHQVNKKRLNLLKQEEANIIRGTNHTYHELINYVKNHSLENQINYQYVENQVDIDEFMNYNILQQYIGNVDWPQNNMKYWKEQNNKSKWRWILYDTDMGFSLKMDDVPLHADVSYDTIQRLQHSVLNPNSEVILYKKLLTNETYKKRFISKYTTLINTVFLPKNINEKITKIKQRIEPEISRHMKCWFEGKRDFWDWQDEIDTLYNYANLRNDIMKNHLQEYFSLTGYNTIYIEQPIGGEIFIENIKLTENYYGEYFDNTEIHLKAKANNGYYFVRWSNGDIRKEITLPINGNINIEAIFKMK